VITHLPESGPTAKTREKKGSSEILDGPSKFLDSAADGEGGAHRFSAIFDRRRHFLPLA